MRQLAICCTAVLVFMAGSVFAGDVQVIELRDGSTITGEVLSLSNGIYTLKSDSLGTIKLEASSIRSIRAKSSAGDNTISNGTASSGQVKSLQEKMMSDQEIMRLVQSLQNDPEFKKVMEDPDVMKAVNAGDVAALTANPKFMKLLNNATVQEIEKKVK